MLTAADGTTFLGELWPVFTEEMDGIALRCADPEPVFEDGVFVTSCSLADELWDAYLAEHDVRFAIEFSAVSDDAPLSGKVKGDMMLRLRYSYTDDVDPVQPELVLEASLGSITIDADAYKAQTKQIAVGTRVELSGIHPVTVQEGRFEADGSGRYLHIMYTCELDFTGASVELKEITFTPTDTQLLLHLTLPEEWTAAERQDALSFHFVLTGKDGQQRMRNELFCSAGRTDRPYDDTDWTEYDFEMYDTALSPSEWAEVETLTIIPATHYAWEMDVTDRSGESEHVSFRDGTVYTTAETDISYEYDEQYGEMPEHAITVRLDDYR